MVVTQPAPGVRGEDCPSWGVPETLGTSCSQLGLRRWIVADEIAVTDPSALLAPTRSRKVAPSQLRWAILRSLAPRSPRIRGRRSCSAPTGRPFRFRSLPMTSVPSSVCLRRDRPISRGFQLARRPRLDPRSQPSRLREPAPLLAVTMSRRVVSRSPTSAYRSGRSRLRCFAFLTVADCSSPTGMRTSSASSRPRTHTRIKRLTILYIPRSTASLCWMEMSRQR